MPILAIDSMGNLYESDPDNYDGTGCKCAPPKVSGGDVTLGKAYQDSENRRIRDEIKLQASNSLQDHYDLRAANVRNKMQRLGREADSRRLFLNANPWNQLRLTRAASRQAMRGSDSRISISGFGLSADGTPGEEGMKSEQQKGAELAVTGNAASSGVPVVATPKSFWNLFAKKPAVAVPVNQGPIYKASAQEYAQYALNQKYKALALIQAKADARRVAAEARAAGYDPSRDEDRVLYGEQQQRMLPERQAAVFKTNPLMKMVRGF